MKQRKRKAEATLFLVGVVSFVLVLVFVQAGLRDAGDTADVEGMRIAEQSIRRAAVSCYAAESQYPPSYDYIKENYGVRVDEKRFAVHYEVFAANLMPDITVMERAGA